MNVTSTPDILQRIVARKREEVAQRSAERPLRSWVNSLDQAPTARGFAAALKRHQQQDRPAIIAEIKKASPSKGVIREAFDPASIARSYAAHGATCLSVLTDMDFFQGADTYLTQARTVCNLPVLRKEFIIDPYQVYEARALGADAILLIAACLGDRQLRELNGLAYELGMDTLIEVHDDDELTRALEIDNHLIGINNRNLRTFEVSLDTTLRLRLRVPSDRLLVSESGIVRRADVTRLQEQGVNAFLVGETFMRQPDPGAALAELFFSAPQV